MVDTAARFADDQFPGQSATRYVASHPVGPTFYRSAEPVRKQIFPKNQAGQQPYQQPRNESAHDRSAATDAPHRQRVLHAIIYPRQMGKIMVELR
jgi:hypothetical protein